MFFRFRFSPGAEFFPIGAKNKWRKKNLNLYFNVFKNQYDKQIKKGF